MKLRAAGHPEVVSAEPPAELPAGTRVAVSGGVAWVFDRGEVYRVEKVVRVRAAAETEHDLRAPMPGKVTKIFVAPGSAVLKGAPLLVLEAMKMEHQIRAPKDGTVSRIVPSAGQMVGLGDVLVELE